MSEPLRFFELRGALARNASLAKYTSWRTGGAAETLYRPADRDDLARFLRQLPADTPVTALGLGSNTLVRDVLVGAVLSVSSWYFFYVGLGVPLPPGILDGLL
ncbi:MAG: hypothetical protein ABW220_06420 [Burkholderiaceae bacterium]